MTIFEAVQFFVRYPLLSSSAMSRSEIQEQFHQAENITGTYKNYRNLTQEEGKELALLAIDIYNQTGDNDHHIAHIILSNLANNVPGALEGLHIKLLQRLIFWGDGEIYREADSASRDFLLVLLEMGIPDIVDPGDALCALAWIGDQKVLDTFVQWERKKPGWVPRKVSSVNYFTRYAGWEIQSPRKKRHLFHQTSYELVPISEATENPGPVTVIAPHEGHCKSCHGRMVTLFTFDLRDSRMAFLGMDGEQLRIAMCPRCLGDGDHIYTDVDGYRKAQWHSAASSSMDQVPAWLAHYFEDNEDTSKVDDEEYIREDDDAWGEFPTLPEQQLVLGSPSATPCQTVATYWDDDLSQIGGHPEWVQYPEYPLCPSCKQSMMFIGQLSPRDLTGDEGLIYAFLCAPCGKATTGYQQT